jgi:hypothetical protein
MELPILDYIKEEEHKWAVCIGVPYGTHLWQAADSLELNGTFKVGLTKAKIRLNDSKASDRKRVVMMDKGRTDALK